MTADTPAEPFARAPGLGVWAANSGVGLLPSREESGRLDVLPPQPTPLIGRDRELGEVGERLLRADVRLLTLIGPGGVGKTRLAVAVAEAVCDRFADGVAFIDLTPLDDPGLILPAVAQVLGIPESGGHPLAEVVQQALRGRELVLVLDNVEHLVGVASVVRDLLTACPYLTIMATGREPLGLRWEHVFPLEPLAAPPTDVPLPVPDLAAVPSVALFVHRAQSIRPAFALSEENAEAVAAVCRRLDGLPLALELAAARLKIMSPAALLLRLEKRLDLLAGRVADAPERHQTLREAMGWSYALLSSPEQAVFRRLAVFAGGCGWEAAESVAEGSLDQLGSLVDKSLLISVDGGGSEPFFRMLETVREYAHERLVANGELEAVRRRHAEYYVGLAEAAEPELRRAEQATWLARLDRERDNCRVALDWCIEQGDADWGPRLGGALWGYWRLRGDVGEGRARLERLLAMDGAHEPSAARVKVLVGAGVLARQRSDFAGAAALLDAAAADARQVDDHCLAAEALTWQVLVACNRSDYARARELCEEAAAEYRAAGEDPRATDWLDSMGAIARHEGRYAEARALYLESLGIAARAGDRRGEADTLHDLGLTAILEGDLATASRWLREALEVSRELDDRPSIAAALDNLAVVSVRQRTFDEARALCREGLLLARDLGDLRRVSFVLETYATLAAAEGQADRAVRLAGAVAALRERIALAMDAAWRDRVDAELAPAYAALGRAADARTAEGRALSLEEAIAYALAIEPRPESPAQRPATPPPADAGGPLSRREVEVARLIARGLTSRGIAEELVVSEKTIDAHADHIRTKLGLRSRAEIAAWAVANGLLTPTDRA